MRILHMNDNFLPESIGGSTRVVIATCKAMAKRGHDVTILTSSSHPEHVPSIPALRICCLQKLPKRWAHYRCVFSHAREAEVLRIIDEVRPDIIHAHLLSWQLGFRWIPEAIRRGIPCFYTMHSAMLVAYGKVIGEERWSWWNDVRHARWTYNPLRNACIRRRLQDVRLLCVSDALRIYMEQRGYRNIRTIHNGIDLTFWHAHASQTASRQRCRLPEERTLFLHAGRLGYDKGLVFLWDLLSNLPEEIHLVLAGQLTLPIPRVLRSRVHIFSDQTPEQMRNLYAACDTVLVPSLYLDPFPTIVLESQACERPVLATNRGGAKEAMLDGVTGWIRDPYDTASWQQQLQWCIDHRSELPAFGKKARTHMEQHFSLEKHIEKLLKLYRETLKSS